MWEISLLLEGILENEPDVDVCGVLIGLMEEQQLNEEINVYLCN
jgi:hypothetical protein